VREEITKNKKDSTKDNNLIEVCSKNINDCNRCEVRLERE
jgi:hypothetical protein